MTIFVKAEGVLADTIRPNTTLENATTVGEAIAQLSISHHNGMVMMVNGKIAHWNTALQPGDIIHLIPAIGGG